MTDQESAEVNAIRRLLAHYVLTADQAELQAGEIFTDDARLVIPGTVFEGIAAVSAFYEARKPAGREDLANNRRARHHLTTCGIDITGPASATGNTYFMLVRLGRITQMGSYLDRFRKVEGRWRIAERNVVLHFLVDA